MQSTFSFRYIGPKCWLDVPEDIKHIKYLSLCFQLKDLVLAFMNKGITLQLYFVDGQSENEHCVCI